MSQLYMITINDKRIVSVYADSAQDALENFHDVVGILVAQGVWIDAAGNVWRAHPMPSVGDRPEPRTLQQACEDFRDSLKELWRTIVNAWGR